MKFKLLFLVAIVFGLSSPSNACNSFTYEAVSVTPGNACNETSTISVISGELFAKDYVRYRLFRKNSSGGWDFISAQTSLTADQYGSTAPCYDIELTFEVDPTYTGTNIYRAEVTTYRYDKTTKVYTQGGVYTTNEVEPAGHYPTEVQSLLIKDSDDYNVSWASSCIASEFSLDLTALQGPTYAGEYSYTINEWDPVLGVGTVISSGTTDGEYLGDDSPYGPTGSTLEDYFVNTINPAFVSALATTTASNLYIRIGVENWYCTPFESSFVTTTLEIRQKPYITSFYFQWDHDSNGSTPKQIVPSSQNLSSYPSIGGASGELVSDISTQNYDSYLLELKRDFGFGDDVVATSGVVDGIGGAAFLLNPSSLTPVSPYTTSDLALFNENDLYTLHLTVATDGCLSDTYWSYYEVCSGCSLQKMGSVDRELNDLYHWVDLEKGKLHFEDKGQHYEATNLNYEVYSIEGRRQINSFDPEIDLKELDKGIYLILVKSGKELIYREKFAW
jgi:hypothetical protein